MEAKHDDSSHKVCIQRLPSEAVLALQRPRLPYGKRGGTERETMNDTNSLDECFFSPCPPEKYNVLYVRTAKFGCNQARANIYLWGALCNAHVLDRNVGRRTSFYYPCVSRQKQYKIF